MNNNMNNSYKVMIVDDESHGREVIQKILNKYCPSAEIVALADNVETAIQLINDKDPDIVFLDIELHNRTGFEILDSIQEITFQLIFVTAYNHYAIKAIKFAALDYLLKPVDVTELKAAYNKAVERISSILILNRQLLILKENLNHNENNTIAIPTKEGYNFYKISEIIWCKASSNYTEIYFDDGTIEMVPRTLKEYDDLLSDYRFCRVHNSYIVNMNKIKKYLKGNGGTIIMEDDTKIEVSVRKKDSFINKLMK
jgi:two-component system LytT family response regulator